MLRSLRARLTAGLTAVLAVVLLIAGTVAYGEIEEDERAAVDDRLQRTAELSRATAVAAVQEEVPQTDDRLDAVLEATRTSLRLLVGDAVLLETGDPFPVASRPGAGLRSFETRGVRYRSLVTELEDQSLGGLARFEIVTRLTQLEDRLARRRRDLLLLGAAGLLVAAVSVSLVAGRVLAPLARLRATAAAVAATEDLDRRVREDDGPGELRALAASFNAMLARLSRSAAERERALQATRRFAADAGHELRTPLTAVQTTLTNLARHPELDADRRTRMAEGALDDQRRLVQLLDGLQALARGDAPPAREDVDLADVADQAVGAARSRHPGHTWDVRLPDDAVVVRGWAPGLRLLVDNLLENAARHGRPGGTVRIALEGRRLVVEDDGAGVPEAERERIFTPFARLDPTRPGTGLGLALVAQQAEHHGTRVELDRSPDLGGARFAVGF